MRSIAFLFLALSAGCAGMRSPAADTGPAAAGPAVAVPATPPAEGQAPPRAPTARASTARSSPALAAPASAQPVAKADSGPHLDLKGLERRLKDTGAIGVFTKLSLKNAVDDLLAKFRAYHGGLQPPTLADLRPSYELLLMKVQSLIQKDDPTLADDVARSREVIWSVLADKSKFALI
jgi:hypothetical protein